MLYALPSTATTYSGLQTPTALVFHQEMLHAGLIQTLADLSVPPESQLATQVATFEEEAKLDAQQAPAGPSLVGKLT